MVPTLRRLLPFVEAWKGLRRRVDLQSGPAFELPPALRSPTNIVRCPRRSVGFRPRRVAHCARLDARRPIDWRMPVARRPHLGGVSYGRFNQAVRAELQLRRIGCFPTDGARAPAEKLQVSAGDLL